VSGVVALLTDFGLSDGYVGVMKAVMLTRDPTLRLVDLTHEVPPHDIRRGAFALRAAVPYFPSGTVFLGVVDPGVGTTRSAVAIEADGCRFVGPDNGLFSWALRELAERRRCSIAFEPGRIGLHPPDQVVELVEAGFWLDQVSSTFHGRDVFAPVAAALASGVTIAEVGRRIDSLVDLTWPEVVRIPGGGVRGEVVSVDVYGNLITSLRPSDLPADPVFHLGKEQVAGLAPHFQVERPLVALIGSTGLIEIAAPNANAAALLGEGPGSLVACHPARR
jgi:S-adenosylmethionine hydrolase